MSSKVDVAFRSSGDDWVPLSDKLVTARRAILVFFVALGLVVAVGLLLVAPAWVAAAVAAGALVALVVGWRWIGRRVRSWGYAERDDDLVVSNGIWFRRLVVVPYGRMQLVDVKAGPIDRFFGLVTVQLHTAAAASDASIPGLTPKAAAALRDRLAARGEHRSAGL